MAAEVSLRDKIGQMLIMGFAGTTVDSHAAVVQSIAQDNLGGVILFDYDYQTKSFDKNIASPQQVHQLTTDLQRFTHLANQRYQRPQLPLLIAVDYEGGQVNRLKEAYGFPATVSAAEVGLMSEGEAHTVASSMALTLNEAGINLNFAPMLDVNVNADNPVIGKLQRSFSANPSEVARYARIYAQNFLSHGIHCAYKHFPGHGSADADSHVGFVDVTHTWQSYELEPYAALLNEAELSCGMVMTAHIINRQLDDSGLPATLSRQILTGMLRQQLHFDGVIITDDMQMKAISDHYGLAEAIILAINAGADMFIFGNQLTDTPVKASAIIDIIAEAVNAGDISQSQIGEAYRRIITFKHVITPQ